MCLTSTGAHARFAAGSAEFSAGTHIVCACVCARARVPCAPPAPGKPAPVDPSRLRASLFFPGAIQSRRTSPLMVNTSSQAGAYLHSPLDCPTAPVLQRQRLQMPLERHPNATSQTSSCVIFLSRAVASGPRGLHHACLAHASAHSQSRVVPQARPSLKLRVRCRVAVWTASWRSGTTARGG